MPDVTIDQLRCVESAVDGNGPPDYQVNEYTPDPAVVLERTVAETYVRTARRLAARGFVQSTLGNIALRVSHPGYPDGVCYVKPAGLSLEEVEPGELVITDIPHGRILCGEHPTTVGHQMNREILRLRPDINCVIHLHHDETIAFLAAGHDELRVTSITFAVVLQKPPHYLPAHVNVEADVAPIKTFIQDTNCIIMRRHGITVLGRTISEAYHRTTELAAEARRNILVETLAAAKGTMPDYLSSQDVAWMFEHGAAIVSPSLIRRSKRE